MTDGIEIEGKKYISSKRAAELTGYAKDYVGQLCRMGKLDAKLIGRNWLVCESSLMEHRFGADALESSTEIPALEHVKEAAPVNVGGMGGIISPYSRPVPARRQPVFRTPIGARFYPGQVLFYDDNRPLNVELTLKTSVLALKDDARAHAPAAVSEASEQTVALHIVDPVSITSKESTVPHQIEHSKEKRTPKVQWGFAGALGMSAAFSMMILAIGLGALLVGTRQVTELDANAGGSKITKSYFVDFSI